MSKKLVAYFSASGVTKAAAERLARSINADLFEIRPTKPYSRGDLDWTDRNSRSSVEMNNPNSRPEIADRLCNASQYDTVFLGFPIWWYVAPHIILTFLESNDFSGKKLVPFATSGGSGMGKTADVLKSVCPNAIWQAGKTVNGMSEKEISDWAKQF